jgi:hypothetical protein
MIELQALNKQANNAHARRLPRVDRLMHSLFTAGDGQR